MTDSKGNETAVPELRGGNIDRIGDIAISPDPSKQNGNQLASTER